MAAGVVRVLLADDQRLVRESLATLLGLLDGVELVGTAADGDEALELAARETPDVVLMDLRMPRCDGIEATRRLTESGSPARVIALTTYADDESVLGALRAGARGYLTKDAGADDIRRAIQAVARGEAALDPAVQRHVVSALAAAGGEPAGDEPAAARRPHPARGRGAGADRRRAVQPGDRRAARRLPGDGQEPHQPPVRQGGRARPRAGRRLRLPARPGALTRAQARDVAQLADVLGLDGQRAGGPAPSSSGSMPAAHELAVDGVGAQRARRPGAS